MIQSFSHFLSHFLDVAFARDPHANVWQAMSYSIVAFTGMYVVMTTLFSFVTRLSSNSSKIVPLPPKPGQIRDEIIGSAISIVMFGLLSALTFLTLSSGYIQVAGEISVVKWLYEITILMLWNEFHFYLVHRALHRSWLFKYVHVEHHRSRIVTPYAVWRFHWLEALLLGSVLPIALIFHAFSVWSLLMLPLLSLFWNCIGHSNWKPASRAFSVLADASARHALHHSVIRGNYGFALPYLDKWLGTQIHEKVTN